MDKFLNTTNTHLLLNDVWHFKYIYIYTYYYIVLLLLLLYVLIWVLMHDSQPYIHIDYDILQKQRHYYYTLTVFFFALLCSALL